MELIKIFDDTHVKSPLGTSNTIGPAPSEYRMQILTGWPRRVVDLKVALHIYQLAVRNYGSLRRSSRVIKALYLFKKSILGGIETKLVKLNGRYYHSIYAPGYPSKAFDNYIEAEFNRISPFNKKTNELTFIFFAITKKCPLQCEHCFEWNNLNKKESFNLHELQSVVSKFQADGLAQIHLSGGEPMVRIKDLLRVISDARKDSEFYVLTSGFNFTLKNAYDLKRAGLTGVVISLDHYEADLHNTFRGFQNSFDDVLAAIQNAQRENFIVCLSLCATRTFTTWENLMKYAVLVKSLNVPFIQVLEPKAVGHYEGKNVFLDEDHFKLLDRFYQTLNFNPAYNKYPVILYHGYYQRRVGCLAGGSRTLYIDSEGYVNACPFCHTKNYNIKGLINATSFPKENAGKPGCIEYSTA